MKNLLLLLLLWISAYSYSQSEILPSRKTLKKVLKKEPLAEKIDVKTIYQWNTNFDLIRKNKTGFTTIDLRDEDIIDYTSEKGAPFVGIDDKLPSLIYKAFILNDSTLYIKHFDPQKNVIKEGQPSTDLQLSETSFRKYIFHKNGDIEIKIGNMIPMDQQFNTDDQYSFIVYIDGETGLIVYYQNNFVLGENIYRISTKGELLLEKDYRYSFDKENSGKKNFDKLFLLQEDLINIMMKIKI